jgi:hypothetical protein
MRWRRDKTGDAGTQPSCESSLLGHPGARFPYGKRETGTKREKTSNQQILVRTTLTLRRITIVVSRLRRQGSGDERPAARGALDPAPGSQSDGERKVESVSEEWAS